MKTNIEKLLNDRKGGLDLDVVPNDAWENIRQSFDETPNKPKFQLWKVAAVVFMSCSIGLLVYNFSLQKQVTELASLSDISEDYQAVEQTYQAEINQLTSQMTMNDILDSEELAWMAEELMALDKVNNQYREDIGTSANQELLVEALVDYYEKKIRLLKKIELEINRQKNEERTTTRTSTI